MAARGRHFFSFDFTSRDRTTGRVYCRSVLCWTTSAETLELLVECGYRCPSARYCPKRWSLWTTPDCAGHGHHVDYEAACSTSHSGAIYAYVAMPMPCLPSSRSGHVKIATRWWRCHRVLPALNQDEKSRLSAAFFMMLALT